jgi:hypothetical protein
LRALAADRVCVRRPLAMRTLATETGAILN